MRSNSRITKSSAVIPESELWLHTREMRKKLSKAIRWAEKHPAKASDLDLMERKLTKRR